METRALGNALVVLSRENAKGQRGVGDDAETERIAAIKVEKLDLHFIPGKKG